MSEIRVDNITDEAGTGKPGFPNGITATGAALTDPEITGGIYLGGTGSANYLDDYEEGTWTPLLADFNDKTIISDAQYSSTFHGATYIKIGRLVTLSGTFRITDKGTINSGNRAGIGGLPFPVAFDVGEPANNGYRSVGYTATNNRSAGVLQLNAAGITFGLWRSLDNFNLIDLGDLPSGLYIESFSISYLTDS